MRTTNRLIATATALVAIGAVLAGCTSPVTPDVRFSAEKLTISLPTMVVGQALSPTTLPQAMGGKEGLVYSLSPDVPGLTFDPAIRVLSGTPTTPGTYDMTYTAKDSATGGTMESVTFTIAVDARPLTNQERILGTWQSGMNDWSEDDGREGIWVDFLTFTKMRFVLVRTHILADGSLDDTWAHHGTWEITDQEIIRIWYHNDDDDETPDVLVRFPKSYFFHGDELFVHHWADENVEGIATNYDGMTRVVDASLSLPPLGVWVRDWYDDDWFEIDTMTIESDGTFTWSTQDPNGTWTLMAEWELDLDNYFINLKNADATWTPTGEEPEPDEESMIHTAEFLRVSYAPMMSESGERMLRVSRWDNELEAPYGEYWREMKLQQ